MKLELYIPELNIKFFNDLMLPIFETRDEIIFRTGKPGLLFFTKLVDEYLLLNFKDSFKEKEFSQKELEKIQLNPYISYTVGDKTLTILSDENLEIKKDTSEICNITGFNKESVTLYYVDLKH